MDKTPLRLELARREFWQYAKLTAPDFYKEDRSYLKRFCNELQAFYESEDEILVINLPPRFGKSRTAQLFVGWILGKNPSEKIMTASYNETLSTTFARGVRNTIQEEKADANRIVYSDVFPATKIKRGEAAANLWSVVGGYNSYLATSPSGTATGFGASVLIIDDLIKNAEDAYNETTLQGHWEWFNNTMLSRLEQGGKIIVIMTRWASKDLAGRALHHYKKIGAKLRHINLKARQDDGTMLCDEILSAQSFDRKCSGMNHDIVLANYQQEPIDVKGRLYTHFAVYVELPKDFYEIRAYTDTADKGVDYLATIIYGVWKQEAYVLDVIYTKEPMEVTEPLLAKKLHEHRVNVADIESNNGGRGFARSVERIMNMKYSNRTIINTFYQSRNKTARILSASSWVMAHVKFPEDWELKWPEFYSALMEYQKEGKNKHDDAPDALTGVYDKLGRGNVFSFE